MRGVNPLPQVTQDMLKMMLASVKLRVMPHTQCLLRTEGEGRERMMLTAAWTQFWRQGIAAQQLSSGFAEISSCLLHPGCRVGGAQPLLFSTVIWLWIQPSGVSLLCLCWLNQGSALALPFNPHSRFLWASLVSIASLHTNFLGQDRYYYEFCKFCQKPPEDFFKNQFITFHQCRRGLFPISANHVIWSPLISAKLVSEPCHRGTISISLIRSDVFSCIWRQVVFPSSWAICIYRCQQLCARIFNI